MQFTTLNPTFEPNFITASQSVKNDCKLKNLCRNWTVGQSLHSLCALQSQRVYWQVWHTISSELGDPSTVRIRHLNHVANEKHANGKLLPVGSRRVGIRFRND
jgi:hypothetical protein